MSLDPKTINAVSAVLILPVIYVATYFGFLALASEKPIPTVIYPATQSKTVTIITGNKPALKTAVKVFKPAMWIHSKAANTKFSIKVHMLA